ncbi:unnamed protein product [Tilletia controversa]|uniref:Dickkopf N-terminal cysteine-rich domain-containing protein n=3 Tax=Tilletia TaxID=13289 RepID=A0A8X7MZ66_9BASI|nr:hypothetical protein CF336_g581 [Tilletia laevis]KAE8205796.1 hypothetical protein CF328_g282 [Tilletia controversa]KAE8263763.1 hypothetical protein A4X03_0g1437 [Tilletia caries]KAE8208621.1 hypothetical protein CF335_g277 [Tilletia laevis]KAE8255394.1 hypothetical protein A4X06_0g446 [Tilletia controversa]
MRFFDFRSTSYVKTLAASFVLALVLVLALPAEAGTVNKVDVDSVALLARANTTSTAASTAVSTAPSTTTSSTPAATATKLRNKQCSKASQCTTGVCDDRGGYCYGPDGRPYICDYRGFQPKRCRQAPLGHSCAQTGDCGQGVCNKNTSTCTFADIGGNCVRDTHCKSPALCDLKRRKCAVPTDHTIAPQQPCATNEQCRSGKCEKQSNRSRTKYLNYNGDVYYSNYEVDRNRCAFFALGQSGCQDYTECQSGFCYNGKCAKGEAGDQCIINDNCGSGTVCGLDGKCYLPPATNQLGPGEPTNNAETECYSGTRSFSTDVQRPIPLEGGQKHATEDDVCNPVYENGQCRSTSDCYATSCVEGICKKLALESRCDYGEQCLSGNCQLDTTPATDQTYKTCARRSPGYVCDQDDSCLSNYCRLIYAQCDCDGNVNLCDGSLLGGECREASDCKGSLNGTVTCNARLCTPTDPSAPHPTSPGPRPTYTTGLGSAEMPILGYPFYEPRLNEILLI